MAEKYFACKTSEVPSGAAKIVNFKRLTVGVFKLSDGYYAMLNVCPHKGAAVCEGPVCGTTRHTDMREFVYEREGELVRCAWHGWEFDIRTGEFLVDKTVRVKTFPVSVDGEDLYIHV
jgi:nitrite reductase/ring-hydroxylating ferredoxin subunit